jgi:hypothetical protein
VLSAFRNRRVTLVDGNTHYKKALYRQVERVCTGGTFTCPSGNGFLKVAPQ